LTGDFPDGVERLFGHPEKSDRDNDEDHDTGAAYFAGVFVKQGEVVEHGFGSERQKRGECLCHLFGLNVDKAGKHERAGDHERNESKKQGKGERRSAGEVVVEPVLGEDNAPEHRKLDKIIPVAAFLLL
jgi:hypothetical protein